MLIANGDVFTRDGVFIKRNISIENGKFCLSVISSDEDFIDAAGCMVIPGLIDIHTHGAMSYDFCDASSEGLTRMSDYYINNGITSVCATSVTLPEKDISNAYRVVSDNISALSVSVIGVNMEGPFFSFEKKGAQNPAYLLKPDYDMFMRLNEASGGNIRIVCIAPELPGAIEFIKKVKDICIISIAHTTANYEKAMEAFNAGANHVTHLFNGMNPFLHRATGVVGAALDSNAFVELISDGYHLHPSMMRSVFKLFGAERICLISDSMCCAGANDGTYNLAGLEVEVSNGIATLANGTIAGSSINLMTGLRRVVSFGINLEDAIISCTKTPANAIGMGNSLGIIDDGYIGDCVIMDRNFKIKSVIKGGEKNRQ